MNAIKGSNSNYCFFGRFKFGNRMKNFQKDIFCKFIALKRIINNNIVIIFKTNKKGEMLINRNGNNYISFFLYIWLLNFKN